MSTRLLSSGVAPVDEPWLHGHQPEIVVVGSVNRDYVLRVAVRPSPGETVGGAELVMSDGGKGANQAVAAAGAGRSVCLMARVGDDPESEGLVRRLTQRAVDTRWVLRSGGARCGAAFVTVTPDGENEIVVAPGANALLGRADILVRPAASAIEVADVLVLQLEIGVDVVAAAIESAGPDTTVVLNAAPAMLLPEAMLARVDVLVVNEHEALTLLGSEQTMDLTAAAFELAARGPDVVVVTLGARGSIVLVMSAQEAWCQLAERVGVVDTTGAGDVFMGTLAAALVSGERRPWAAQVHEAVGLATRAGSRAVSHEGARLPA